LRHPQESLTMRGLRASGRPKRLVRPRHRFSNRTGSTKDISGYYLTDTTADLTKFELPAGTTIPGRGHISFTETELGLDFSITEERDRVFVALSDDTGDVVVDAFNFEPHFDGFSESRMPSGDREFDDATDPTRDAPNQMTVNQDVVINELMYHTLDDDREKQFIELYNRGSQAVDMTGWSFSRGISFDMPDGQTIAPGAYLVIARNPDYIRTTYNLSESAVIGPETEEALDDFGALRGSGERVTLKDEMERTVDTLRYWDGGEWPRWADGHGSSMELIDPLQDNRFGQAWDASDDSDKAEETEFSYVGRHGGGESELHVLLLNRGITVVDDLSVVGGGVSRDDTPIIDRGEVWRYFKGTQEPPANWREVSFNDNSWLNGATGIGYGDGDDATELNDMRGNYISYFARKTFNISNPNDIDELILNVLIDDGYVAYLNGEEIDRYNMGSTAWDASATGTVGDSDLRDVDVTDHLDKLRVGTNVLAFQIHNTGLDSSDTTFNPSLIDRTTTQGGGTEQVVNPHFNSNANGWMIEGTHHRSGRTNIDPINGAGSLKIVASGRGDNKVNRIETTNSGIGILNTNEDLLISLKARWVIGSQTILTHGFEHAMARTHELAIPDDLGTPGRINSVTLRQNGRSGGNLGPVFTDLEQTCNRR
ncbi:MAG: lamin tail domain-containing protein, partial [Planctomycetota bacterium]